MYAKKKFKLQNKYAYSCPKFQLGRTPLQVALQQDSIIAMKLLQKSRMYDSVKSTDSLRRSCLAASGYLAAFAIWYNSSFRLIAHCAHLAFLTLDFYMFQQK